MKNNVKIVLFSTLAAFGYTITANSNLANIETELIVAELSEQDHENNINTVVEHVAKSMNQKSSTDDLVHFAIALKHDLLKALNTIPRSLRYQNLEKSLHNLNIKAIEGKQITYATALTFANQIKYLQEVLKNLPEKSRILLVSKVPNQFKMFIKF